MPEATLSRIRVLVTHLGRMWPNVLHRQICLREFGSNERLRKAIDNSYAAHTHNLLVSVLFYDLIREVSALVLDPDARTGSLQRIYAQILQPGALGDLRREYEVTQPIPLGNDDELTPAQRAEAEMVWSEDERSRSIAEFVRLRKAVMRLRAPTLESNVANKVLAIRNKGVAHQEFSSDAEGARPWSIRDAGLTYGELDAYIDQCSKSIEKMELFVRRAHFEFSGFSEVRRRYVREYVDALCAGREQQIAVQRVRRSHDQKKWERMKVSGTTSTPRVRPARAK